MICTCGPADHPFEERHRLTSISLVLEGVFTYRGDRGTALLSPGSVLLGNASRPFECAHHHGEGDRCLSFQFAPDLFGHLASDLQLSAPAFRLSRLPPMQALATLAARSRHFLAKSGSADSDAILEELAFAWGSAALNLTEHGIRKSQRPIDTRDEARVVRALQRMRARLDEPHPLVELAAEARLSRYHFLRVFNNVTGVTPHQWLVRQRLADAAQRLTTTRQPITEIALDVGFEDLSNFVNSFRSEYSVSPGRFRLVHA